MANLNRIVNINIDIKTPAVSAASFDNLLIVGPAPATAPEVAPPDVGSYTDLEGVTEAGWVTVGGKEAARGGGAPLGGWAHPPRPKKPFPGLLSNSPSPSGLRCPGYASTIFHVRF